MKKKKLIIIGIIIICAALIAALFAEGIFRINTPSVEEYPVRGVDVSSHQGMIDWEDLSSQSVDFAYIKATEGSNFADECFRRNFDGAMKSGVAAGAYHFFSYDSAGAQQAQNFIANVPVTEGMLPPAADVEFYGKYESAPPEREQVRRELSDFLYAIEEHYGVRPVIYATMRSYELYIKDDFSDYPLWIRDVYFTPSESIDWQFWQYSDKGRLTGYIGEEKYIDLNVYAGSGEELELLKTGRGD